MTERDAYLGFSLFSGVGPLRFKLLIDYFSSALTAWNASHKELCQIGLGEKLVEKFITFKSHFDLEKYLQDFAQKEIKVITRIDSEFPQQLREISDPPIVLYIKGNLPKDWSRAIGIVGTRKPTPYGKEVTEKITRDLISYGFTVISGLARGVDGITHRVTIDCGGITIAVLGCGVDVIYPPEHRTLYGEIITKGGAVVSEVVPGHTVARGLFPARNRIIAGLSRAIIVTEGAEDSGSLITASCALEQGRDVFAVPGPITSYLSAGPAKLIKQGAKLISNVTDILEEYGIQNQTSQTIRPQTVKNLNLNSEQKRLVELLLHNGQMHYDELVRQSSLPASLVGATITQLELSGILRGLGDGRYCLI